MLRTLRSLYFGFTMPVRAAKLILAQPKLLAFGILPFSITGLLYFYSLPKIQAETQDVLLASLAKMGIRISGNAFGLSLLSWLLVGIVALICFSFLCNLLAIPFNDLLAEQTERFTQPVLITHRPTTLLSRLRIFKLDLMYTFIAGMLGLIGFVFSLIPLVGMLGLLMSAMCLTLQFISYPCSRREIGPFAAFAWILKHFAMSLGFGLVFLFLFAVPLMSPLVFPLAVVGGTVLFAKSLSNRLG